MLMCGAWERFSHSICRKAFECGKCGFEITVAKMEVSLFSQANICNFGFFWGIVCCIFIILLSLWSIGNFCKYASIKAIESPFKEDDQLWLTYWVLYSFVTLLELVVALVITW